MPLDFPASPSNGTTYTGPNGVVWIWDGVKWTVGTQSGAYLPLSGGTLTGALSIVPASGSAMLTLNKAASGASNTITANTGSQPRWQIEMGTPVAEAGGNAGSDLGVNRYNDAGAYLGTPLYISRATGLAAFTGSVLLADSPGGSDARVEIGSARTADGVAYIDLHASVSSDSDSRWFRAAGVNGGMTLNNNGTGPIYFGADGGVSIGNYAGGITASIIGTGIRLGAGATYLYFANATGPQNSPTTAGPLIYGDTNYIINRTTLGYIWKNESDGTVMSMDNTTGNFLAVGAIYTPNLYLSSTMIFFNGNTNSAAGPRMYVDNTNFAVQIGPGNGVLAVLNNAGITMASLGSDGYVRGSGFQCRAGIAGTVRGNNFNIDWTGTPQLWIDNVLQGQIAFVCDYRLKDNVAPLPSTWDAVKALRPITYTYKACPELLREEDDPAPRWGFLAHELQDTLLPTAATGEKDAPNEVQSPDVLALIAGLTKALQEAMARIEALEGGTP